MEDSFETEPPRVYRRVKLSKDEPYGTEEIPPRSTRLSFAHAAFGFSEITAQITGAITQPTRRLRQSWAAHRIACVLGASGLSVTLANAQA